MGSLSFGALSNNSDKPTAVFKAILKVFPIGDEPLKLWLINKLLKYKYELSPVLDGNAEILQNSSVCVLKKGIQEPCSTPS